MRLPILLLLLIIKLPGLKAQESIGSSYALLYHVDSSIIHEYYFHQSSRLLLAEAQKIQAADTCKTPNHKHCDIPSAQGAYLLSWVDRGDLEWELAYQHSLFINMQTLEGKTLIRLYNRFTMLPITDAVVYRGKKATFYDPELDGYLVKKGSYLSKYSYAYLITLKGQAVIAEIDHQNNDYYSRWREFWYRFSYRFSRIFYRPEMYKGYLAINKPIYKVGDTLKYKAVVLNETGKAVKEKNFKLLLSYYSSGQGTKEYILKDAHYYDSGKLKGEFIIADSLEGKHLTLSVINPRISSKKRYGRKFFSQSISIEDYVLNEIDFKCELLNEEGEFGFNHPLKFSITATDDNELPVLDGRAHLTLFPQRVDQYDNESAALVPNVLLDTSFTLDPVGPTLFKYYPSDWPNAALRLACNLNFYNSNKESHHQYFTLTYSPRETGFNVELKNGYFYLTPANPAVLPTDSVYIVGFKHLEYGHRHFRQVDSIVSRELIEVPSTFKWKPYVDRYDIYCNGELYDQYFPDFGWHPKLILGVDVDSILLSFVNSDSKPVLYDLFNEHREQIVSGRCEGDTLKISREIGDYVILRYQYHGEDEDSNQEIIPLNDMVERSIVQLQANVAAPRRIRPGEKVEIDLEVSDPKGTPEANLDILALSVKKAFDKDPITSSLPYSSYKKKIRYPKNKRYQLNLGSLYGDFFSSRNISRKAVNRFELEDQRFYRYMFLQEGLKLDTFNLDLETDNGQFAAFVYDSSYQHQVYAIEADDVPIYLYYSNFEAYSIPLKAGSYNIKLRCYDRSYLIPRVMVYPGKKTELALNLATLPETVVQEKEKNYFTKAEWEKHQKTLVRIEPLHDRYSISQGDLWFGGVSSRARTLGPFQSGGVNFWSTKTDSVHFYLDPNHSYLFYDNIIKQTRLTRTYTKRRFYRSNFTQVPGEIMKPLRFPVSFVKSDTPEYWPDPGSLTPVGDLRVTNMSDSNLIYYQFYHYETGELYYGHRGIRGRRSFPVGHYRLQAYTLLRNTLVLDSIEISKAHTTYLWLQNCHFETEELDSLHLGKYEASQTNSVGKLSLEGMVRDESTGEGIPFANVVIKSTSGRIITGGTSDLDGSVRIKNLLPGTYLVEISFVGYATLSIKNFTVDKDRKAVLNVALREDSEMLTEVQIAYSAPRIDQSRSSSVTTSHDIVNMAVRDISSVSAQAAGVTNVRGQRDEGAVYFIDGVKVRGSVNIPQAAIAQTEIGASEIKPFAMMNFDHSDEDYSYKPRNRKPLALDVDMAFAGYENRVRDNFQDYAFFIPDLSTDAQGKARIEVDFPDDINAWSTHLVGLGEGFRYFSEEFTIKSFLEVVPRLYVPSFLRAGDSCELVGKTLSYLDTSLSVHTTASVNGKLVIDTTRILETSLVDAISVVAAHDSLILSYGMSLSKDISNGETRKVSIKPRGIKLHTGEFMRLDRDTSIHIENNNQVSYQVSAMLGWSDVAYMLSNGLEKYPHSCNEQLASKLIAMVSRKIILEGSGRRFSEDHAINRLIRRIENNKNSDGGWGWWPGQFSDLFVSNYVQEALYYASLNGFSSIHAMRVNPFLEDALFTQPDHIKISILYVMSEGKMDIAYDYFTKSLKLDSLSVSEQLKYAIFSERNNLVYDTSRVNSLLQYDILGGGYVVADGDYSLHGSVSNSLLMAEYLSLKGRKQELNALLDHLLFKSDLHALNTIEKAAAIRMLMLTPERDNRREASLSINDKIYDLKDGSFFMEHIDMKEIDIDVSTSIPVYLNLSRTFYTEQADVDSSHFRIQTKWYGTAEPNKLGAGEILNLNISVDAVRKAEFVMLEIPKPAGFILDKESLRVGANTFYEDKGTHTYLYVRSMKQGENLFNLKYRARYQGEFHMPQVKAELMYFPVLYGLNAASKLRVE